MQKSHYSDYVNILQKAADLNYAAAVLGWDQEVYMPAKGAAARARQLATLASQAHEISTSEQLGSLLSELSNNNDQLSESERHNIRLSLEDYTRNKKLPPSFVEELSMLQSEGFNAWVDARRKNDYSVFAPVLERMIALKRRQAELLGYEAHPYDALLEEYEKGATVAMLDPVFKGISEQMPLLTDKIKAEKQVSNACFMQFFPKQSQWDFFDRSIEGNGL